MSFTESLYANNPNAVKNPDPTALAYWDAYRVQYGDDATASAFNQSVASVTGTPVWTAPAPSPAPSPAPAPSPSAPAPAPAPTGVGSPAPAPAASPTPPPANGAESATGTNAAGTATDAAGKPADQWFPGVSNRVVTLGAGLLVAGVILFGGK